MENLALTSNLDILKKDIIVDRALGKEANQILCEGDIIVPDIKPDISMILQSDAQLVIDKLEPSTDRVSVVGKLQVSVLYLAKTADTPIHSLTHSYTIDDFMNVEGLTKEALVDLRHDIEALEFSIVNDRKISYRGVVNLRLSSVVADHREAVVEVVGLPLSQQQQDTIHLSKTLASRSERFVIKTGLDVPSGKPNISEILSTTFDIRNKNVRAVDGRVQVTGELNVTVLYRSDTADQLLDFFEFDEPFTSSVDMDEATEDMFADANLRIVDKYVQVLPNDDGEDRLVVAEATLVLDARVGTKQAISYLRDAYSTTEDLQLDTVTVSYPRFIARNKNQATVKEIVTFPSGLPPIMQVYRVKSKAHLLEAKLNKDKVVVEGHLAVDIIYVAKDDTVPLFSHQASIPYRQVVETIGAEPDMDVVTDLSVDGVHFNLLSETEVEVRATVSIHTTVTQQLQASLVRHLECVAMDPDFIDNQASITVYVVTKGETLWQIAKRYYTTVEELLTLNDMANPEHLVSGQKLIILKGHSPH